MKRILSLLLIFLLMASMFTGAVSASPAVTSEVIASGRCGDAITWTLDSSGHLTLTGTGRMYDYTDAGLSGEKSPWFSCREQVLTVSISDGITDVGECAFEYCTCLTACSIPDSVTEICSGAFEECKSLTTVAIPAGVTEIGSMAFCESGITTITLPEGITVLHDLVFKGTPLREIFIPDSVSAIETSTFSYCRSLASVSLPGGLTSIGLFAFNSCAALTDLKFRGTGRQWKQVSIKTEYNLDDIVLCTQCGDSLFWNLDDDGLLTISGEGAMEDYDSPYADNAYQAPWYRVREQIREVKMTAFATTIGSYAFSLCTNLTTITLPAGLEKTGTSPLYSCINLKKICFCGTAEEWKNLYDGISRNNRMVQYAEVSYIDYMDWKLDDDGLLTIIGRGKMENFDVDPYTEDISAAPWAESGSSITAVKLLGSLTSIGDHAFDGCENLKSVTLTDSVTSIGSSAFYFCTGLTDIAIPSGVTYIGEYAFGECRALEMVVLPAGLTEIEFGSFFHCTGMTLVNIPAGVTHIYEDAFGRCWNLKTVFYEGTQDQWDTITIEAENDELLAADIRCTTSPKPSGGGTDDDQDSGKKAPAVRPLGTSSGTAAGTSAGTAAGKAADTAAGTAADKAADQPAAETAEPAETGCFADVPAGAYYADAAAWAAEQGIAAGISDTAFSPERICTRGQMVTFLWRAAGCPAAAQTEAPFTDVSPEAYYYEAVLWAAEQGITAGTSETTFSPDDPVTRAQAVTLIWRAAGSPAAVQAEVSFADISPDAYCYRAVLWAVEQGITTGTSPAAFSPDTGCTRAQIVTFLYRAQ